MDARPALQRIADALAEAHLEAVLIGLAGAALQGAPVTTQDFDFMFRRTPSNLRKIRKVAERLKLPIYGMPYYPSSTMIRMRDEAMSLQLDFLSTIHGIRSFEAFGGGRRGCSSATRCCSWPICVTSSRASARRVVPRIAP
jgi:hypothetical protein